MHVNILSWLLRLIPLVYRRNKVTEISRTSFVVLCWKKTLSSRRLLISVPKWWKIESQNILHWRRRSPALVLESMKSFENITQPWSTSFREQSFGTTPVRVSIHTSYGQFTSYVPYIGYFSRRDAIDQPTLTVKVKPTGLVLPQEHFNRVPLVAWNILFSLH